MAKGKHAPAPGAVRKDKIIHPKSRQATRIQKKQIRRDKVEKDVSVGATKLQSLGNKLNWFKENLQFCQDDESDQVDSKVMLLLAEAYLSRFDEEIEQIKLKHSIGAKGKRKHQHVSRLDAIEHAMKLELDDFEGCGLEMPDLFNKKTLESFNAWNGELRFVQNIAVKRFTKLDLQSGKHDQTDDAMDI